MVRRIVALILSFIYCGLGQLANRQIVKGLDFIVIYTLLLSSYYWPWPLFRIIGLSLVPLMWFIGMMDAFLGHEAYLRKKLFFLGILPGILIAISAFYIQYERSSLDVINFRFWEKEKPEIAPVITNNFSIQIAVSGDMSQTKRIRDGLLLKGYMARVEESTTTEGQLFHILVGSFATAAEAEPLLKQMRTQEGFTDSIVYNSEPEETNP